MGFAITFNLSWGLENSTCQLTFKIAQHGITARCGDNRNLEFESSCGKDRLGIFDVAKRLDELVLVIPIDLQNYANDYTFLIPIHLFKTGWMKYDVFWESGSSWTKPIRDIFSHINCGNSTVRKVELRERLFWKRVKETKLNVGSWPRDQPVLTNRTNSDSLLWLMLHLFGYINTA